MGFKAKIQQQRQQQQKKLERKTKNISTQNLFEKGGGDGENINLIPRKKYYFYFALKCPFFSG